MKRSILVGNSLVKDAVDVAGFADFSIAKPAKSTPPLRFAKISCAKAYFRPPMHIEISVSNLFL
jgi:hypothetical protein